MSLNESFKTPLMLDQWDRLSLTVCEDIARDLDRILPRSFRFHKIETCALGDQKHHVAVFEWAGLPEGYYHGFLPSFLVARQYLAMIEIIPLFQISTSKRVGKMRRRKLVCFMIRLMHS